MIGIVIDTNVINSGSKNFTIAQFSEKLEDIIREIEANDNYQNVKILLPKIVIEELFLHQLDSFNGWKSKLEGLKMSRENIVIFEDYKTVLKDLFDEKIRELKAGDLQCEVIPYPYNESLPNIIDRALSKKAPFEGVDKSSDKGFKDVILWESLMLYKRLHLSDTLILYSGDKRVCDNSLAVEYKKQFEDDIFLILRERDDSKLFSKLSEICQVEFVGTFSEKLKQDLIDRINEETLMPIFEGSYIPETTSPCTSIEVVSKDIIEMDTAIVENTISCKVLIVLKMISEEEKLSCEIKGILSIKYSLEDKKFYLYSISSDTIGDIECFDSENKPISLN